MKTLHIEPYLDGQLSLAQQRAFEQAMLNDQALQQQLRAALAARQLVAELAQQDQLQKFAQWETEAHLAQEMPLRRRRILSMAAALGMLLFLSMGARLEWVGHNLDHTPWKELMRPVQTEPQRWEAMPTPELQQAWVQAQGYYLQQEYQLASEQLIALIARLPEGEAVNRCRLYLGSTQLMLQQGEEAVPVLLGIELGSRYALEARYLIGLAYWKEQAFTQADQQLTTLSEDIHAGRWQEAAVEALEVLTREKVG